MQPLSLYLYSVYYDNYGIVIADVDVDGNDVAESIHMILSGTQSGRSAIFRREAGDFFTA